jgi:DNA-binding MurR/RpiR family transcriptional regulator
MIETMPRFASFASAGDLASEAGVNSATVVRFAQALGFRGWPEFQMHFRHRYLGSLLPSDVLRDHQPREEESPIRAAFQQDEENLRASVASLDFDSAEKVAKLIVAAPRTVVVSSGSYAAVGLVFSHLARFMGYDVTLEMRGGANLVAELGRLREGDCLFAISFWRLNREVVLAAKSARGRGISTVSITDSVFSPLALASDHALIVPTEGVSFFQSSTAAISLVHGLLGMLCSLGGERVSKAILDTQELYGELDVLYS